MSFIAPSVILTYFSISMSKMYKQEVPQYGSLVELVNDINALTRQKDPILDMRIKNDKLEARLDSPLKESILFPNEIENKRESEKIAVTHTARFGEIEQRGIALTNKGGALYDRLLLPTRDCVTLKGDGRNSAEYMAKLAEFFAYFHYKNTNKAGRASRQDLETFIEEGFVSATPIPYEGFLPVSTAGFFNPI